MAQEPPSPPAASPTTRLIPVSGLVGCVKDANGSVIAGTCSSDRRLKQAVTPFARSLETVARLQPVSFAWRAEEFPERHLGSTRSFGLIAQDVEAVLPDLVTTDAEGYKAVKYHQLPMYMLQAIKDLLGEKRSAEVGNRPPQRELLRDLDVVALEKLVAESEALIARARRRTGAGARWRSRNAPLTTDDVVGATPCVLAARAQFRACQGRAGTRGLPGGAQLEHLPMTARAGRSRPCTRSVPGSRWRKAVTGGARSTPGGSVRRHSGH